MNAFLNVEVRVLTLQARQRIRELENELRVLQRSVNRTAGMSGASRGMDATAAAVGRYTGVQRIATAETAKFETSLGRALTKGTKFGNQLQWTGRQLQYNFALPLALAGAAAAKSAMDQEKAMTRVRKVYGDSSMAAGNYNRELSALEKNFEALSNRFGVARKDVIAIAGDWAAAGSSGAALARGVQLTLTAMTIGEMNAADATQALIAIQAQYGITTKELTQVIADLNVIENETGASMSDLITAMSRGAAVARMAGVDHRHLAAFVAALVPAAGSAATAGNGLKTMIGRLMAPTNEAADAMKKMGINVYDASWQSLNASERFVKLAEGFKKLTAGQKIFVADLVAGKWQISKFAQIMQDAINPIGYYNKALKETEDPLRAMKVLNDELTTVLKSNPQKFKQAGVIIQNSFADVLIPLLPYIVFIAQKFAQLAQGFAHMSPYAQGAIMALAGFLIIFGPLIRYIGSTISLFATMGDAATLLSNKLLKPIIRFMTFGLVAKKKTEEATAAVVKGGVAQAEATAASGAAQNSIWARAQGGMVKITGTAWKGIQSLSAAAQARIVEQTGLASAMEAGARRRGLLAMWAEELDYQVRSRASWSGFRAWGLATDATWGAKLAALDATTMAKLSAADDAFIAWSKAKWAGFRAWMTASEATGDAAQTVERAGFMARLRALDDSFIAWSKAKWAGFNAWSLGADASAKAKLIGLDAAALGRMRAMDDAFIAWSKAKWGAFQAWGLTTDAAAKSKLLALDAAAKTRLRAMDDAFIGWSKAKWAAYRASDFAQAEGFKAKGLALDATAKTRLRAMDDAFIAAARTKWAAFRQWGLQTDARWGARLTELDAAALARLQALDDVFIATSRAKWAGYWASMVGMAQAGQAKIAASAEGGAVGRAVGGFGSKLLRLFTNPWVLATLAVVGILYHFRDDIARIFGQVKQYIQTHMTAVGNFFSKTIDYIATVFYRLPEGVQSAMLAVVRVVKAAAMAVYHLFSYLNPFAHHSPSLVESVTAGFAAIRKEYASVSNAGNAFAKAAADLARFKTAAAALGQDDWAKQRADVAEAFPSMMPLFNTLTSDLANLNKVLAVQEAAVAKQQAVVDQWAASLKAANAVLDAEQGKLETLKGNLDTLTTAYNDHKTALENYASAPLAGMGAMEDQIFANEQAQKKLRLEMLKWEDVNGSIDDIRNNLALLQGDIESATSEATDLRASGAGSDILGPIADQINAMQAQYDATQKAVQDSPMTEMQKQLADLQRQGEMLDLQKSLQFDPMTRDIEKLANAQKELSYEEIVAGINKERAAMDALQPQIDAATTAVNNQQKAVDAATAARDAAQASYDKEKDSLQSLQDEYSKTEGMIRDVESALNSLASTSRDATAAKKAAADAKAKPDMFAAAAAADFPDVGGLSAIGREGGLKDQTDQINALTEQLNTEIAGMFGKVDFLKPIKEGWKKVTDWWATSAWPAIQPVLGPLGEKIGNWFGTLFDGKGGDLLPSIKRAVQPAIDWVMGYVHGAVKTIGAVWRLIGPDIKEALGAVKSQLINAWNSIGGEMEKWGDLFKPLKEAAGHLLEALKGGFILMFAILLPIWKVLWSTIAEVVGPILDTIIGVVTNALQMIRGVIQVILALINGDWGLAWDGIVNIVEGAFGIIGSLIKGAGQVLWGIVKGIVQGIYGFFKWLYDELVGHSIIPDTVDAIVKVFKTLASLPKWIWDNVLVPIGNFFKKIWTDYIKPAGDAIVAGVKLSWEGLKTIGQWIFDWVLKPIYNFFKAIWTDWIKPAMDALIAGIKLEWDGIKTISQWIWTYVLKPITDLFGKIWSDYIRPSMNALLRGIGNVWNAVGEGIATGVNVGISAINKLIEAINWVGSHVPGLSFSIGAVGKITWQKWTPPQFATGGVLPSRVGEGFATNQARAIVGEGGRHPEYVIPTDPKHRHNALKLYGDLGKQLGDQPMGGWGIDIPGVDLGSVAKGVKDAATGAISYIRKGAVIAAFAGPLKAFDAIMSAMPNKPQGLKDTVMKIKNDTYDWAKGIDGKLPTTPPPGVFGSDPITGAGWQAIDAWLNKNSDVARTITSTLREGDTGSYHALGRAVDYSVSGHNNAGYNAPGLRAIFDALLPAGGSLTELILAGAPFNIKDGKQVAGYAWGEPGQPGNHWNHVHAALAAGAILKGPVHAMMGEAGPEVVTPLAPLWARLDRIEKQTQVSPSMAGGGVTININGNLEFPNISSGADAESFVRNLEILARK